MQPVPQLPSRHVAATRPRQRRRCEIQSRAMGRRREARTPRTWFVGALIVTIGLASCGNGGASTAKSRSVAKKPSPYVIGLALDLTGSESTTGQENLLGLQFYARTINGEGGIDGHPIKLDLCDTQSTATGGSICGTRLASVPTHVVVSATALGGLRAAEAVLSGTDLLISNNTVLLPKASTTAFQVTPLISDVMVPLFSAARAAGITTLGVVATSDASGVAQLQVLSALAPKFGIRVVSQEMSDSSNDSTSQLLALKSAGAGAIFAASIGAPVSTIISSYERLGLTLPLVVGAGVVTNEFLKSIPGAFPSRLYAIAGPNLGEGGLSPSEAQAWARFRKEFTADTHQPIDEISGQTYYEGCIVTALLGVTHGDGNVTAMTSYLRSTPISCLGTKLLFNNAALNVVSGLPSGLVQAARTAAEGWGPVRTPL